MWLGNFWGAAVCQGPLNVNVVGTWANDDTYLWQKIERNWQADFWPFSSLVKVVGKEKEKCRSHKWAAHNTCSRKPSASRRGPPSPWFPPGPWAILAWCYSKVHSAKEIHSLIPFNTVRKTMIFPPEKSFTISHGLEAWPKRTGSLSYQEC